MKGKICLLLLSTAYQRKQKTSILLLFFSLLNLLLPVIISPPKFFRQFKHGTGLSQPERLWMSTLLRTRKNAFCHARSQGAAYFWTLKGYKRYLSICSKRVEKIYLIEKVFIFTSIQNQWDVLVTIVTFLWWQHKHEILPLFFHGDSVQSRVQFHRTLSSSHFPESEQEDSHIRACSLPYR